MKTRGPGGRGALAVSTCLLALVAGAPARADEPATTTTLSEIIVTATQPSTTGTKSDTPAAEVPQSLSIVGQDLMQAQDVQTVAQAISYLAGVFNGSTAANGRYDRISLRGFDVTNTGVLQDGLRATTAQTYTKAEPYGLERVEVLRGPASVLYGQNAPGGVVNMISKRPTDTALYEVELQGGSFDRKQGQFDISGPIADGVAFRLTGLARDSATQISVVPDDKIYIAPALSWHGGDKTTLTLLTSYSHEKYGPPAFGIPLQGSILSNPNGRIAHNLYTDEPGVDNHRDQYAAGLLLDQGLWEGWTLQSAVRYTDTDFVTNTVSARGSPVNGRLLSRAFYHFGIDGGVAATDHHVQGDWRLGGLEMKSMAGADYRHTREDYSLDGGSASALDVFAPVYGQPYGPATTHMSSTLQSSDQTGVYGEQQVHLLENLILSADIRHDWSDTGTRNRLTKVTTTQDDQATTWRTGLVYRGPWGLTPYVSYATSFNPILGTNLYGEPYRPSRGEQVEGGLRVEPAGWRTYLTLTGYSLTQTNVQTTDPTNSLNQIQTGEVRSQGFEAEVVSSPMEGLNITGSVTIADLTVTKTTVASQLGRRPTAQPDRMAALWADYTIPSGPLAGLGWGGGVRYVGSTFADAANTIRVPDYAVVDAMVHYDRDRWRLALNATNLADKRYYVSCSTTGCGEGTDRTFIASLRYRWGAGK
ncbi:MAG: TonB-dependent siderophore receptor [Azospirillaceae bacterium]|nr:TonB-dependent siderophore receptor [Azospirillaceae bacterium]